LNGDVVILPVALPGLAFGGGGIATKDFKRNIYSRLFGKILSSYEDILGGSGICHEDLVLGRRNDSKGRALVGVHGGSIFPSPWKQK
jgi:hypothetical protein